jgi:hypothetical protein
LGMNPLNNIPNVELQAWSSSFISNKITIRRKMSMVLIISIRSRIIGLSFQSIFSSHMPYSYSNVKHVATVLYLLSAMIVS